MYASGAASSHVKALTDVHSPSLRGNLPGFVTDSSPYEEPASVLMLRVALSLLPQTHACLMPSARRMWGNSVTSIFQGSGPHCEDEYNSVSDRSCSSVRDLPKRIKHRLSSVHLSRYRLLMAETSRLLEAATVLSRALGASNIPHCFHGSFLIAVLSNAQQCNVRHFRVLATRKKLIMCRKSFA